MDGAKVKNIIIGLLLLVNLFLLAVLLHDRIEASEIRREARKNVEAVFAENGIRLLADVPWNDVPELCSLHRDMDAEYGMVRALLGRCSVQDLGGNILFYRSEKGEARFRGTGEFQIMLTGGEITVGDEPEDTARSILRRLGLRPNADAAVTETDGQTATVTLTCQFHGSSAYNCTVSFLFTADSLLLIDGRRPLERSAVQDTQTQPLDAATVLMRYLSQARTYGIVFSEIRSVEAGGLMSVSAAGEGSMTPFWRIETDVGQSYVNGLTGKIESIV